jgi:hypothetical protein
VSHPIWVAIYYGRKGTVRVGYSIEKLIFTVIGGVLVAVLSAIILAKLGFRDDPSSATPVTINASPPTTGDETITKTAENREVVENASSAVFPVNDNASDDQAAAKVSGVCQPRIVGVQNQSSQNLQRFLDPSNEDCLPLDMGQLVDITIQNCQGASVQPRFLRLFGEYQDAFLATTNNPSEEKSGVFLNKNLMGWNIDQDSPIGSGSHTFISVRGNGGNFCAISIKFQKLDNIDKSK